MAPAPLHLTPLTARCMVWLWAAWRSIWLTIGEKKVIMMFRNSLLFTALLGLAACGNVEVENTTTDDPAPIENTQRDFMAEGKQMAQLSFKTLSGELKNAMQQGGVENAIGYCNVNALRLTDSLSSHHGATIRRATVKPRNANNAANAQEQMVLDIWEEKLAIQEELKPTLFEDDENAHFYAPITIKPQCLNCHGQPGQTMPQTNADFIANLYPKDKAVGYNLDELRGMWHITFKK